MSISQECFDGTIGRLDRLLSEFLLLQQIGPVDEANRQTLKHHADDLIGVGAAMLKRLNINETISGPAETHPKQG